MLRRFLLLTVAIFGALPVRAVILDATGDPSVNTTAPGGALAGSGWQYQGTWGGFLGTPIAPNYFITANHIGGNIGEVFTFQGHSYTTDATANDPASDLRIWHVTEAFPYFAPLYTDGNEVGRDLVVIGRGTQRGDEVRTSPGNVLAGWNWGVTDNVQRWGTNTVSSLAYSGTLLAAQFDNIGGTEAHLSSGDSGGAVFIQDPADDEWKLAGINYAVSGPYFTSVLGSGEFISALFEETGFFVRSDTTEGVFVPATGPGEFYATRISSHLDFIQSAIPEPGAGALLLFGSGIFGCLRRRSV